MQEGSGRRVRGAGSYRNNVFDMLLCCVFGLSDNCVKTFERYRLNGIRSVTPAKRLVTTDVT